MLLSQRTHTTVDADGRCLRMTLGKEMTYAYDGLSGSTGTTVGGSRPPTYAYDTVSQQVPCGKNLARPPIPTSPPRQDSVFPEKSKKKRL